jgi:hypothetical protein
VEFFKKRNEYLAKTLTGDKYDIIIIIIILESVIFLVLRIDCNLRVIAR